MTHDDNDDEMELQLVYRDLERLRQLHAELLLAAKIMADHWNLENSDALEAAIAKAEQA